MTISTKTETFNYPLKKAMTYYVAIGNPKNHSGLECKIECELQIGDYVEMWHEDNCDDDDGELVIIASRVYSTFNNTMIFYANRVC